MLLSYAIAKSLFFLMRSNGLNLLLTTKIPKDDYGFIRRYLFSLKTLKKVHFKSICVAVDLTEFVMESKTTVQRLIVKRLKFYLSADSIQINFQRPSTKEEWIVLIERLKGICNDSPWLLMMNHDHFLINSKECLLVETVNNVFFSEKYKHINDKILFYSHTPELISWTFNFKPGIRFKEVEESLYMSSKLDKWVDSFFVAKIETVHRIFLNLNTSRQAYVPRIDWTGLSYSNLRITSFIVSKSLFEHYDGYSHISSQEALSKRVKNFSNTKNFKDEKLEIIVKNLYYRWRMYSDYTLELFIKYKWFNLPFLLQDYDHMRNRIERMFYSYEVPVFLKQTDRKSGQLIIENLKDFIKENYTSQKNSNTDSAKKAKYNTHIILSLVLPFFVFRLKRVLVSIMKK